MAHEVVAEAEAILDKEFKVHNHGFVRLVDYYGSDNRIVASARVSYGLGTKTPEEDKKLIHYLMKNLHTSPFEQVVFTFHVKMPIFVARQWVRHRTARLNEISGRYSVMKDECYLPEIDNIRPQSRVNKQGRDMSGDFEARTKDQILGQFKVDQEALYEHYEGLIEKGVAKELARINLPLSLYTEMYWQIDLHNLFHFLRLRLDNHSQFEIRAYAKQIFEVVKVVCPVASEAFIEHILEAKTFSKSELIKIRYEG